MTTAKKAKRKTAAKKPRRTRKRKRGPVSIRDAMLARLAELGQTPYWLSKQVEAVGAQTVQRYLYCDDDEQRRGLSLAAVEECLAVLGLELVPVSGTGGTPTHGDEL